MDKKRYPETAATARNLMIARRICEERKWNINKLTLSQLKEIRKVQDTEPDVDVTERTA